MRESLSGVASVSKTQSLTAMMSGFVRYLVHRIESDHTTTDESTALDTRRLCFWAVQMGSDAFVPPIRFTISGVINAGHVWPADSELTRIKPGYVFTPPQ